MDLLFLEGPTISVVFKMVRGFFIALNLLFLFGFLYALRQAWNIKPKYHVKGKPKGRSLAALRSKVFQDRWGSVLRRFSANVPDTMRLAIIEADTLVDSVLKDIGLEGEHMADRLAKLNPTTLKGLNGLWRAHRLRNDLVHTPGFALSPKDAREAIKYYEDFLREIKILR